jgi:hypothetical protein
MFEVRKKNLDDLITFKKMFGDNLGGLWASEGVVDFESCAKVVYTLLVDKTKYKSVEVIDYDLDGNEIRQNIGGYKALLRSIETDEERTSLLEAFVVGMTEEVKKKIA